VKEGTGETSAGSRLPGVSDVADLWEQEALRGRSLSDIVRLVMGVCS